MIARTSDAPRGVKKTVVIQEYFSTSSCFSVHELLRRITRVRHSQPQMYLHPLINWKACSDYASEKTCMLSPLWQIKVVKITSTFGSMSFSFGLTRHCLCCHYTLSVSKLTGSWIGLILLDCPSDAISRQKPNLQFLYALTLHFAGALETNNHQCPARSITSLTPLMRQKHDLQFWLAVTLPL